MYTLPFFTSNVAADFRVDVTQWQCPWSMQNSLKSIGLPMYSFLLDHTNVFILYHSSSEKITSVVPQYECLAEFILIFSRNASNLFFFLAYIKKKDCWLWRWCFFSTSRILLAWSINLRPTRFFEHNLNDCVRQEMLIKAAMWHLIESYCLT